MRTSAGTFSLLTGMNTPFSSSSAISFCLNEVNDESMLMILKMTLAIDAKYFLNRPRPRLIDSVSDVDSSVMSTIESMMRSELV
jgi:hypothetical protein